MAVLITRQPQSACVAPNSDATFTLTCQGDIASYDWQYSTDLETWTNIGLNANTMVLKNVQYVNSKSFYRCKIIDSTDDTPVYSAPVELFVFDETFIRKVIKGGDMFLAMVDVYTSIRHQTTSDLTGVIASIQEALNQKSSVNHVHDTRYYTQTQTDDKYITDLSISDKTITITYGDSDTDTITTPDYRVTNAPAATTKAYVTGTTTATESTGTQVFDTGVYLDTTAGHLTATQFNGNLVGNVTGNALNDTLGQQIDDTYIKGLSIDDRIITYTKGDGDTGTITTQDYRVKSEVGNTTKAYVVGSLAGTDTTGTLIKDTAIFLDTTAGKLTALTFNGNLTGNVTGNVTGNLTGNALNDTLGQQIDDTYIKGLSISDKTITFTYGDGDTDTITTQDYRVTSEVDATTKAYVVGTTAATEATGTLIKDTGVYLDTTAGHLTATQFNGNLVGNVTGNALNDTLGQQIDDTYIKGLSISDKTITYTKGDGDTGTITTQDYRVKSEVGNTTKAYVVGSTSNEEATGTLIKDTGVYLDTTAGNLTATTFNGNLVGNVTGNLTGNALNDTLGQQIDDTYIAGLSISDKTITYTKGDGDTGTITTQDYRVKSEVGNTTKAYVVGTTAATEATGTLIKDTGVYLDTTAGHLTATQFNGNLVGNVTGNLTGNALNDTLGQQIDDTYIAGLSISDKTITYTMGDGDTGTITTQDYRVTSEVGATTKAYIVGTTAAAEATGTLIKDTGVYLDTTAGHLTATQFNGNLVGNVTGNLTGNALNDTLGQQIDDTYIAGLSISDKTITFTYGDGDTDTITTQDYRVKSEVGNTTKAYLVGSTSNEEATGTLIKDTGVYLDTTAGKLTATSFSGNLTGNVTGNLTGNALNDTLGQQIDDTYIKGLSIDDKVITYTKGDGDTGTITTQDYRVKSEVGNTTKAYVVGTTAVDEATGTLIKDTGVYLDTTAGKLTATTFNGNLVGNVTGNALNDTLGQQIDDTYIKDLSISDKTITYTKGDGDTGTITTQDYRVKSEVGNTTKAYLVGSTSNEEATGTLIKDTGVYLDTTAGKLTATTFNGNLVGNVTGNLTGNALNDTLGQQIDDTYIKGLSVSGRTITYTKGDDDTGTITTQDTTYTAGTGLSLSGTEFSHPNSGVTAGTYKSVTVDALGHVTAGTNPTTVSGYGITDAYTKTEVDGLITDLIDSAPAALDTFKELADALGNDPNYATTVTTALSNKIDKSDGIASLSISDKTITYTKGDGTTTGTITTPDYRVKTTPLGDTSTTKVYLSGTSSSTEATGTENINSKIYFQGTTLSAPTFSGALSGNATTATTADKLGTDAGSATQPVYFSNGVPVATTYSLGKSVPSDAVFTDTNNKVTNTLGTTTKAYLTGTTSATTSTGGQIFDTGVYLTTTAGQLKAEGGFVGNVTGNLTGNADTATKLGTADKGSATQGIYLDDGEPKAMTYTLGKSVPSDAVFTDTNNAVTNTLAKTTKAYVTGTTTATTNTGGQVFDTGVYLDTTAGHLTATQFNGALNGKANTAGKLHSAVNITIGGQTKSFDGSGAISFDLATIGAQASGSYASSSHSHNDFGAASADSAGTAGFVPAPAKGDQTKFLRADKTWTAVTPALIGASATGHTHSYAGSASAGGAATSANKINTDAGSATQPVYFSNGVPVATTYSLGKSVPSDAVFTDTNNKVTNTVLADNAGKTVYLTGTQTSTTATGGQNFNTKIYFNNTTLTAPTFSGALSGKATSAGKLQDGSTDYAVGSATQPVYFSGGVPVATTYTLGKSVPSDAVFTDTNNKVTNTLGTTTKAYVTGTTTATTNTGGLTFDTGVYLDTTAGHLTATQFNGALNGKANTAGKLHSAVNITVGSKTNSFDGSAAISFSLSDIGAAAASHGTHVTFPSSGTPAALGTANNGSATTVARSDHVHALPSLATLGAASSSHSHDVFTGTDGTSAGVKGFVPAPATTDAGKFLKADGTWAAASYSNFGGSTANAAGTSGLVPAPAAGTNTNYYLCADGSWKQVSVDLTAAHQTSGTVGTGYYHRNIAYGTSATPTTDATYGGSGAMYVYYS